MFVALVILVGLLAVGGLGVTILHDLFLSRLRAQQPEIWLALGPPTRFFDDWGLERSQAVHEFLRKPEYHIHCNEEVLRLARFIRAYERICGVFGFAVLASLLFYVWTKS